MKTTEMHNNGKAGSNGAHVKNDPKDPAPIPGAVATQVADKALKAQDDFKRLAAELGKVVEKRFSLLLQITFLYIVLKVAKKEAYVAEVFEPFQKMYKDKGCPSMSTLQHYEGPLRKWLRHKAFLKNPQDPNLNRPFTTAFLAKNPNYFLTIEESELDLVATECGSMVEFDRKYANGRVKPSRQQAGAAPDRKASKPARVAAKKPANRTQGPGAEHSQGDSAHVVGSKPHHETRTETSKATEDHALVAEVRTRVHQLDGVLTLMISKGIPVPAEIVADIRTCYGKSIRVTYDNERELARARRAKQPELSLLYLTSSHVQKAEAA